MPNTTHSRPASRADEIDTILGRLASPPLTRLPPLAASEIANIANIMRQPSEPSQPARTDDPLDRWYVSTGVSGSPRLLRGDYGAPSIQEAKDEYINELKANIKQSLKRINNNMSNIEHYKQTIKLINELVEAEPASQPATRTANPDVDAYTNSLCGRLG